MKASEVRVLLAPESEESAAEENFLVVETVVTAQGEASNIDHVTFEPGESSERVIQRPIARSLPYPRQAVLEWAVSFAALNDIPVVYERRHEELADPLIPVTLTEAVA